MENKEFTQIKPATSLGGVYVDYFGNPISVGNTVVFKSCESKCDSELCRATVKGLITTCKGEGEDFCVLDNVETIYSFPKVKNGSKKSCRLCVVVK